jgi:hypothetical protein
MMCDVYDSGQGYFVRFQVKGATTMIVFMASCIPVIRGSEPCSLTKSPKNEIMESAV